jgi:hypothetical protein
MRKLGSIVLLLILVVLTYLAGYLSEHRRRAATESHLRLVNAQLAYAEEHLGICGLENQLLGVLMKVDANNYGDALKLSTEFFDGVPKQMVRTQNANFKSALQSFLEIRDSVTAALSRNDRAAAADLLRPALERLHSVLERPSAPAAKMEPKK